MASRRQGPPVESEPELRVPRAQLEQEIDHRAELGRGFLDVNVKSQDEMEALEAEFHTWDEYNEQLFRTRFTTAKIADEYKRVTFGIGIGRGTPEQELRWLREGIEGQLRKLASIRARLPLYEPGGRGDALPVSQPAVSTSIFVVHGHDGAVKLEVAEFLEQVTDTRPIILHEQPDMGRTVIEKFETHASGAGFAVILLTADDVGKAKDAENLNTRARQNVVLEFGYFIGKLGRSRVVAVYEPGVELPSDVRGVLYKSLAGNWHTELARELRAAGIPADLSKLR